MNNETIDLLAYRAPLLLFQRLSSNLKFKKIAKNFKIKISKICSTIFFAHWHTDDMCHVS